MQPSVAIPIFPCRRSALVLALCLPPGGAVAAQTQWQLASPATSPPARHAASMAYDPVRQRCLMLGGTNDVDPWFTDAWEWDGTQWSSVPYPTPWGHLRPVLAHDPIGGGILAILFGETGLGTWRWDGASWSLVAAGGQTPPTLSGAAFATAPNGVLLFGGETGTSVHGETWVWNGSAWRQTRYTVEPPRRAFGHMAFDSARRRVVLGGGAAGSVRFTDTWTWDLSNGWLPVATGPAPAIGDLAYDSGRDRMVKVGRGGGPGYQPPWQPGYPWGTYELDPGAQTWSQRSPVVAPSGRAVPAVTYDEQRGQVVMFGGLSGRPVAETWLYAPVHQASFTTLGAGCGPTVPSLSITGPAAFPWVGGRFEVLASKLPVGRIVVTAMLIGSSTTQWGSTPLPISLAPLAQPGCELLVSPDVATPLQTLPSSGRRGWAVDVPDTPILLGASFFIQAVGTTVPFGPSQLAMSPAGVARIGGL
ncbi:MAG: hypothetical protein AAF628_10615 [Planctomycetota bacterium]